MLYIVKTPIHDLTAVLASLLPMLWESEMLWPLVLEKDRLRAGTDRRELLVELRSRELNGADLSLPYALLRPSRHQHRSIIQ